jgi:type I restriction enzyme, S subunit
MESEAEYLTKPALFKKSVAGSIPKDWLTSKLSVLVDPSRPISYGIVQTGPYVLNGIRCIRVIDIENGRINNSGLITTSAAVSEAYKRTVLHVDDIVMPLRGRVGDAALVGIATVGCNLTRGVALISTNHKVCAPYCLHYITSIATRSRLAQSMNGSALQELPIASLRAFEIAYPQKRAEQEAIANALSDADSLIESLEQLLTKKRQIKQGAMQELLTGTRRLPGFSGEWKMAAIADVASVTRGASPRPIDDPVWFDDQSVVGWVRISDVTQARMYLEETTQRLSPLGIKSSRPVPENSLIMSICATVGRPVLTRIATCIHDGFVVFDDLLIDQLFFYYVLCFIENDWGRQGQTGSQMNLNTGLINSTIISIPKQRKEQSAIAAFLSDLDVSITTLEGNLTKARQIKQGMMQELLTGRIRLV